MDRDNEALRRRMAEQAAASSSDESSDDEQTYVVREGAVRSIDADELNTIRGERDITEEGGSTGLRAELNTSTIDPTLDAPPDLPEMTDVSSVGPDGSSVDQGLTDPLGGDLGGNSIAGGIRGRAAALGGDALGRGVDFEVGSRGSSRDMGRAISTRDGSQVSEVVQGDEFVVDLSEDDSEVVQGDEFVVDLSEDDSEVVQREEIVIPADVNDPILDPGYAQPDPTGGDDVIISEAEAAALAARAAWGGGDPTIIRPTDEASVTGYATNLDNNPDNITNYGPEGPQSDAVANWAPPPDLLFDPPPEGASAGMAGAQSAMADPAAALGGSSVIGSSTPDEAPPPPDPPPGDDPDQGPLGPPGGDGGDS